MDNPKKHMHRVRTIDPFRFNGRTFFVFPMGAAAAAASCTLGNLHAMQDRYLSIDYLGS